MLQTVTTLPLAPERFREVLTDEQAESFQRVIVDGGQRLAGRVVWNVNSTAHGGGVA